MDPGDVDPGLIYASVGHDHFISLWGHTAPRINPGFVYPGSALEANNTKWFLVVTGTYREVITRKQVPFLKRQQLHDPTGTATCHQSTYRHFG